MFALATAFAAGLLTTLNPCVLPVLPVVIATAFQGGRFGPAALVAGLVAGFAVFGTAVAATGSLLGLAPETVRLVAGVLFVAAGLMFLWPALGERFAARLQPLADRAATASLAADARGLGGQALIGLLLGAIWTPCAGPALGAAVGLAAEANGIGEAFGRMLVFGLGAGAVLLVFAYGWRAATGARREGLMRAASRAKPVAGLAFAVIGAAVLTGWDKRVEALATDLAPAWLIDLGTRF